MTELFKYISNPELASAILDGSIKFAPVAELNDPTEFFAPVDRELIKASLVTLRQHGYSESQFRALQQQGALLQRTNPHLMLRPPPSSRFEANAILRSRLYDMTDGLVNFLELVISDLKNKIGVFCLSDDPVSMLMWSHYANGHQGFVVGYKNIHQHFEPDETGTLDTPTRVKYGRSASGVTFDPQSTLDIFFSKGLEWQYENETRILRPLMECEKMSNNAGGDIFVSKIDKNCISTLIAGSRMQELQIKKIADIILGRDRRINFLQAVVTGATIELRQIV